MVELRAGLMVIRSRCTVAYCRSDKKTRSNINNNNNTCYSLVNKGEYIIYYAYTSVYKVSLLLIDLVVAFVLFIFMLVYRCVFFVSLQFLGE